MFKLSVSRNDIYSTFNHLTKLRANWVMTVPTIRTKDGMKLLNDI